MASNKKTFAIIKNYLYIFIGCVITAAAIDIFFVPNKIAPGGLAGIATVVYYITNGTLSIGVFILLMNVPLFLFGMRLIGKKFLLNTAISTVLLSVFIDIFEPFTNQFVKKYLGGFGNIDSNSNLLLYCIIGGAISGLGLGLVLRAGATTGGTDLAAKIAHKFLPNFSVGQILLFIDAIVVVFASIAFKSFLLGLYAIVTIYITSKVVDAVLEGVNYSRAVFIISDYADEISARILKEINRGVTGLDGTGMYTKNDKKVLLCVLERSQIPQLKKLVKEVDQRAFVVMTDIREVLGEGFGGDKR